MRLISTVLLSVSIASLAAGCATQPVSEAASSTTDKVASSSKSLKPIPQRVASNDFYIQGQETLKANLAKRPIDKPAKNVILFIADGMDPTTITSARILDGQNKGMSGEENVLSMEKLPHLALSKTYTTDSQVPDSAGTASAMVTGVKTKSGVLSISDAADRGDCAGALAHPVKTAGELAKQAGMAVGIVSTARITHATPATVYSHSADRNWETDGDMPPFAADCTDIASQLIEFPYGGGIDVVLGGGRGNFLPEEMADPEYDGKTGRRTDGRNLAAEWEATGGTYVWDRDAMMAASGKVLGLFEPSHMQFEADRDDAAEPSIAEMTTKALELLSADEDGYFLMVEGGRVDHAHHAGNAARALTDAIAFDEAVARAMEMTDREDTLIIVTADHGHTMTISGYPARGNPILGIVKTPLGEPYRLADGKPYTTLTYANGPGAFTGERPDVTEEEAKDVDYIQQALLPTGGETHSGQDVTIFAGGPQAYLLDGTVEQNYIFHVIDYALNLNERAEAADTE